MQPQSLASPADGPSALHPPPLPDVEEEGESTELSQDVSIDQPSTVESTSSSHGRPQCRICLDHSTDSSTLIRPCKCSGTMAYIHVSCLQRWASTSGRAIRCATCNAKYATRGSRYRRMGEWPSPDASAIAIMFITIMLLVCMAMLSALFFWLSEKESSTGRHNAAMQAVHKRAAAVFVIASISLLILVVYEVYLYVESNRVINYADRESVGRRNK